MIHPVILCGGSGTRLWPSSRRAYPKQFIPFLGEDTLFQRTLKRFSGSDFDAPIVLTNVDFRFMATEQAASAGLLDARVVVEPVLRDTAPAVLTAALMLKDDPDGLMLVAPSDHIIADENRFREAVHQGVASAEDGALVTFGVQPNAPETGYGYLELSTDTTAGPVPLKSFREKPDRATAEEMISSGAFLWNAGIFLFRIKDIIEAFSEHAPDLIAPCQSAIDEGADDVGFFRLGEKGYAAARAISFDYAVMEKASNVTAVPMDADWSDLGSWDALWAALDKDEAGVAIDGHALAVECENSLLRSEEDTLQLVGVGLKNIVAVAMRDAVLVADMGASQQIKSAVKILKDQKAAQAEDYPRFHRPWGWYETLCLGHRFQVKRIMVKPGGVLSLQSHMHRSEHWVVVAGTAEVTVGEEVNLLSENQSVYIPVGTVHRMANPGKLPMYLIEVQTGAYLGEDDIIRYEDIYNRG
ncbi:MAG: mannose-1-phosphate guanylyltransferase/mannose-6-phosphate isomerase [Pseudomonadota bacterium]